jgi:Spy/CpxP family protein refolding chaperone
MEAQMASGKWFLCAALVLVSGSILIAADAVPATPVTPATQPSDVKPTRAKKLTLPWSMLKDLTPEQTTQIEKIHADAEDQIHKIEAKEKDDINALLTPEQATELKVDEAKKKELAAKARKMAATQP